MAAILIQAKGNHILACKMTPSSCLSQSSPRKGRWMRCWGARAGREKHKTKYVLPPRSGLEIWVWELILSGLGFVPENRASPAEKKAKQPFCGTLIFSPQHCICLPASTDSVTWASFTALRLQMSSYIHFLNSWANSLKWL